MDYFQYFQTMHGMFVIKCQMMQVELSQLNLNLEQMMNAADRFSTHRDCLVPHVKYRNRYTIVVDLENTFVTLVDIKNTDELEIIKNKANFATDYILIEVEPAQIRP